MTTEDAADYEGSAEVGDDEQISVPVMHEEVSVEKRPVLTEEVQLNKRRAQDPQTVSATLRKERASVETSGDADVTGNDKL